MLPQNRHLPYACVKTAVVIDENIPTHMTPCKKVTTTIFFTLNSTREKQTVLAYVEEQASRTNTREQTLEET